MAIGGDGGGNRDVIVGIRPENLEDGRVVDTEAKSHGATFKAKLDLVQSLGAEYYAYFHLEGTRVESEHLNEVADQRGRRDRALAGHPPHPPLRSGERRQPRRRPVRKRCGGERREGREKPVGAAEAS